MIMGDGLPTAPLLSRSSEDQRRYGFAVELLRTPRLVLRNWDEAGPVGTVLLLPLHDDAGPTAEVEVGWHLHPGYQGRGYATEAATALLGAAAQAGLAEVLALTDLDNLASQAVAGRLGMTDEGLTDRWYGITARQYRWTREAAGQHPGRQPPRRGWAGEAARRGGPARRPGEAARRGGPARRPGEAARRGGPASGGP
jgi:RimJ/RimL family protein N-acetyltransferase